MRKGQKQGNSVSCNVGVFLQKLLQTSVTVLKAERGMANSIGMSCKDCCETTVNLHGFLRVLLLQRSAKNLSHRHTEFVSG
jgi:hypothetical protein